MGTRSNLGGGGSESRENRPRSVLSMLRRPLSAISRPFSVLSSRAKSALSNRSTGVFTLPTNVRVRALVRKFVEKARGSRRKDVDAESIDSLSTLADPDRSVHSHSIKKKLDSLAGSTYGDYNSHARGSFFFSPKLTSSCSCLHRTFTSSQRNSFAFICMDVSIRGLL